MRFKLNIGRYVGDDPEKKARDGSPLDKLYVAGMVIETDEDLTKLNSPGMLGDKFTRMDVVQHDETIEDLEARIAALRAKQAPKPGFREMTPEEQEEFADAVPS